MVLKANDPVNPNHYKKGAIECFDGIKSALTKRELIGFLKGQVLKYTWRCGDKDLPLQEMKKAQWYLDKLILELENEDPDQY